MTDVTELFDVTTAKGRAGLRREWGKAGYDGYIPMLLDYIDELEQAIKELDQHNEHLQWSLSMEIGRQGDEA